MMTEESRLFPLILGGQCDNAIRNLQEKYAVLDSVNTAIDGIKGDNMMSGNAFVNIKRHMGDHRLISDAIRDAAESEETDFVRLKETIGTEILIGSVILRNKESAEKADKYYTDKINECRIELVITAPPAVYSLYDKMLSHYTMLSKANEKILHAWEEKEDRYNEIEQNTMWLFSRTLDVRMAIKKGLELIAAASIGLPRSYDAEYTLAQWRVSMQTSRNKLAFENALAEIRYIDGDEAYEWVKGSVEYAKEYLNTRGFYVRSYDLGLLREKYADYKMITEIDKITEEKYSYGRWKAANTQEQREDFLREYMNEIMGIMGLEGLALVIDFSPPGKRTVSGMYYHTGNNDVGVSPLTLWINPDRIKPRTNAKRTYKQIQTVVHELRHAYQRAVLEGLVNTKGYEVSDATRAAWKNNLHNRIKIGESRTDATIQYQDPNRKGRYTWEEYRNQPIEIDAFSFGEGKEWYELW